MHGRTWDFSRCPLTGQVLLWPRENSPHWVGQPEAAPAMSMRPTAIVMPNPLNQSVRMICLAQTQQRWAGSRPVAVVGEVAAGRFDVTIAYHDGPETEEVLLVPAEEVGMNCFALRVRGTSMQQAGIEHGDYVLVRSQSHADNGDFVIATLTDSDAPEGYATLKQFFWEGDHIRLQPANAAMAPIHLYPERRQDPVKIQGKVMAVIRYESLDTTYAW